MVSELEKTSLEISLKVMSSQVSTPPLIGGITYGEQVVISDIDAQLINILGNPDKLIEAGATEGMKVGEKFNIRGTEFIIDAVQNNLLTGFNGAIIKNTNTGETILWADGSKGFNNIFTSSNIANTLLELGNDWVINDILGIGSDSIFPQLQNLKDFAESYGVKNIDTGIGQSMMGVGMSALAFTKGFENINFRTYSGCVTDGILRAIDADENWGLNNKNGANLKSFINENEPLTKLLEPAQYSNEIYMKNHTDKRGIAAHSASTYFSDDTSGQVDYTKINNIDSSAYPLWDTEPRISFDGNGFSVNVKLGSKKKVANTASEFKSLMNDLGLYKNVKVKNGNTTYNVLDKKETIIKLQCTEKDIEDYNAWVKENSSDDDTIFLDPEGSNNQIRVPAGSLKGTDTTGMDEYLNNALNGDIHADTIAPSGVTLPSSGKTSNTTVEHYTSKPQMMSQNDIFQRALKEGNIEALKTIMPNIDKKTLNALRVIANLPGNPLKNLEINNALNGMLFGNNLRYWLDTSLKFSTTGSFGFPMAIDLDGEGIETIDINDSQIYFDVDNDGFREQTGWISKNEAILAIDKNGNGKIDDQSEMFGSTEKTGFEELKELDSNGDGIIDAKDKDFSKIRVWQDLNENGVTDEGELKTAEEAGIKAIYTNSYKMNGANNNNLITEKATIQYTDGTTKDLYDVATQYNDMYTVYGGDYILDADVIDLPWLRGYGNSIDLQLAASQNDNLKAIIKEMAAMTSATSIYNKFDDMMSLWLGENKTGEEMQKLVLSKLIKLDLENMSNFQANNISNTYNSLKSKLFVEFIAQTGLADKFDIAYDYKTDTIIYSDNTYENIVRNTTDSDAFTASYIIAKMLADDGSLDVTRLANTIKKLGYGSQLINYINSGLKFKNGDFTYVEGSMPLYVIGSDGNDTITGGDGADIIYGMDGNDLIYGGAGDDFLNGGRGNDTLYGGDGNDTLIGGEGDDTLIGGGGDDTYIYDGDGKDAVFDEKWITVRTQKWVQANYWTDYYPVWEESKTLVDAGDDIVIFGKNVTIEDITISQNGNNLVFGLKGTNNTLTIKNWYVSKEQRVETFQFANGLTLTANQILRMIKDTAGNNSIIGTNKSEFIFSTAGNDTITGGKGNDVIVNQSGDTIYKFNEGDGKDTIYDYAGNDKIILGYTKDRTLYRRSGTDLILRFQDSKDAITIKDWFAQDANKIETIQFANGETVTAQDILNKLSSSKSTNNADNLFGTDGNDTIHGYGGDDFISTGAGDDVIYGGLGNDIMVGGTGNDKYYVETPDDKVIENANEGNDTIVASCSYELPDNVENLYLYAKAGAINGRGNDLDNTIIGNNDDNIIDGKGGTNILKGGKGNDTYIINASNANDTIYEYSDGGIDTVKSSISYRITNTYVENLILTGTDDIDGRGNKQANYIEGNSGSNVLRGAEGNDTLYGGGGVDSLYGGKDDDTYIVDNDTTLVKEMAGEGIDTVIASVNYTLTNNVENLTLSGKKNLKGTGNSMDNIIRGNSGKNILNGKKGNDTLYGGEGSDTYIFNLGDGNDTIYESGANYKYTDTISFGTGINLSDVKFIKSGNDLIVSIAGTTDSITIKDSNINPESRIEKFVFADGSTIDGNKFYELTTNGMQNSAYSDFSVLGDNSISASASRIYNNGVLQSEEFYDENGNIISADSKTYSYTFNADGSINTVDDGEIVHTYTYSTNLKTEVLTSKATGNTISKIVTTFNSSNLVNKIETYDENNKLVLFSNFTYDATTQKLTRELEKEVIYNSDGSTKQQNRTQKDYTYNADGKVTQYLEAKWFKKANGTYTKYTAVQDVYTYNSIGQKVTEAHNIGYMDENEKYVKYKDEITYSYNNLNKLSTKETKSGYRINNVWNLHTSEKITYEYNEDNGLLSKEIIAVGYENNGTWNTKTSKEYNYIYNEQGLLIEKTTIDYTLLTNGSYSTNVSEKLVNTYDETTGKLILSNTYNGNSLVSSIKYEYIYDDNNNLISQKIYNANIVNNVAASYELLKEIAINSYNDKLYGDDDNNVLYGGNKDDYLSGGAGSDTLYGGDGNDTLDGGANRDVMIGGKGDDTYYVSNATDKIIELGNEGIDTVISDIDYQLKDNVENLTLVGNRANTRGLGNNLNNVIRGNDENNELLGFGGSDYLYGGVGDDTLYGGADDDTLVGGTGNDFLSGSTGSDTFIFNKGDGIDTVREYSGKMDVIKLGADIDKKNIAIYKDENNNLIIDYGETSGYDRITVLNQFGDDPNKYVEKFELRDGSYLSDSDINALIQNMTAYANNNAIEFTGIESVKNNADLMNLVASAWHS